MKPAARSLPLAVTAATASCAAGLGMEALRAALAAGRSGLEPDDFPAHGLSTWTGRIHDDALVPLPTDLLPLDSRNNRLALTGLMQDGFLDRARRCVAELGASRVGVLVGTSTSSIGRTEEAYRQLTDRGSFAPAFRQPDVHTPHSAAHFVARVTGAGGPCMTVSTACSSSAKVFASAARWLHAAQVDAVVVAGVDSLCLSVLCGFHALQLVSGRRCRPFDERRDGINLGEGAGFALLMRADDAAAPCYLSGFGESADAHHMSTPHPEGVGADLAMQEALARARLDWRDIGYVNLHGTASRQNDRVEALLMARRFPETTRLSSTKGWTGHTLGAAGILEAIIAFDALATGLLPGTLNTETLDPCCPATVLLENERHQPAAVMSNSFGFGGSNCSLVFTREPSWN